MRMNVGIAEYNSKLAEAKSEEKTLQDALTYATGAAAERGDQVLEEGGHVVVDENGGSTADLGGILLSPVFYLINFIADAIVSNLESIMMGEDPSWESASGVAVLQQSQRLPETDRTYPEANVSMDSNLFGALQWPNIRYTPEYIFSGKCDLLSVDFVTGTKPVGGAVTNQGWINIRGVVSQWYKALRMMAIVGLLSVLIYTGIKIIISANAKDKAKYKEWIINWFMAVAILFAMHIIMAFITSVIGEFTNLINRSSNNGEILLVCNEVPSSVTNLMGLVRFMVQSENFYTKVAYEVMYIALIVYTIKFTIIYLKRVMNMAFLTLIAPIVALTYPIDKINDGRAQGFDMWLKEYIFNALLQPMHLLLYYILVGSAVQLATDNPLYGIVVLAFMTEAERLLKRIFGFDKASGGTVGGMASAFAAGAIASNIKNIAKLAGGSKGNSDKANAEADNSYLDNAKPIRENSVTDNFSDSLLDDGNAGSGGKQTGGRNRNTEQEKEETSNKNGEETGGGTGQETGGGSSQETGGGSSQETGGGAGQETGGGAGQETGGGSSQETGNETDNQTGDEKAKLTPEQMARKRGRRNVLRTIARPIYDADKAGTGYNQQRWKRRLVNGAKGVGRFAVGAALGTAAAAVQAGISITDGKYNPMEGIATFAAGYAGGGQITKKIGKTTSKLTNAYKQGYYEDTNNEALQKELIKKRQQRFMTSDETFKAFKNKYGSSEKAVEKMKLASKYMLPYGYEKNSQQFKLDKMAQHIIDKKKNSKEYKALDEDKKKKFMEEFEEKAYKQSRNILGFREQLESQGLRSIIRDPDKQQGYIDSEIKARGLEENSDEAKQLRNSLNNAFKLSAVWDEVNK